MKMSTKLSVQKISHKSQAGRFPAPNGVLPIVGKLQKLDMRFIHPLWNFSIPLTTAWSFTVNWQFFVGSTSFKFSGWESISCTEKFFDRNTKKCKRHLLLLIIKAQFSKNCLLKLVHQSPSTVFSRKKRKALFNRTLEKVPGIQSLFTEITDLTFLNFPQNETYFLQTWTLSFIHQDVTRRIFTNIKYFKGRILHLVLPNGKWLNRNCQKTNFHVISFCIQAGNQNNCLNFFRQSKTLQSNKYKTSFFKVAGNRFASKTLGIEVSGRAFTWLLDFAFRMLQRKMISRIF